MVRRLFYALHVNDILYSLLSPFVGRKISSESEDLREMLAQFSPPPSGTCRIERQNADAAYDLEIIIPAYNAERYLDECLESVLNQKTRYSYHVIVVDDGSTDSTKSILDSYKSEKLSVVHQKNGGTAKARNTGIAGSHGRYIMFVDADDVVPEGSVEILMKNAFENDADIVEGSADYTIRSSRYRYYSHDDVPETDFSVVNACIWGKVYSADMFSDFCFPEGYWYEDTVDSFLLFRKAKKVSTCSDVVYVYKNNPYGMTSTTKTKPKALDTFWITELCVKEYVSRGFDFDDLFIRKLRNQFIVNCKRMSVFDDSIQEAVFLLSCRLVSVYNIPEGDSRLLKIMKKYDFGKYRLYSLLH